MYLFIIQKLLKIQIRKKFQVFPWFFYKIPGFLFCLNCQVPGYSRLFGHPVYMIVGCVNKHFYLTSLNITTALVAQMLDKLSA